MFENLNTADADAAMAPNRGNPPPEPLVARFELAAAESGGARAIYELPAHDISKRPMAQFQLPRQVAPELGAPPRPLIQHLTFQYAYGSESSAEYRRDRDLNKRLRDNSLLLTPQVNGVVLYRPTNWLETTLEVLLEKEIPVQEEKTITLPSGEMQFAQKRRASLLVDQAFVRIHNVTAPFEFSVGRKNYEDERHWLFDTSMDIASVGLRHGRFRADATVGREVLVDLDLAPQNRQAKDRIDTHMLYADYRGEDIKLAAYTIVRNDRALVEGRPRLIGVRALGSPSDNLNYWTELAFLRGKDEFSRKFSGHGYDVGFSYRFTGVPHHPNVTLGYAFGTGDGNPNDNENHEFRQSGLQSNEIRFAGIPKFKIYGETLDPELSNLKILTLAFGFRPTPAVSVELVYHRYRLDKIADVVRNWALTAEMNQVETQQSKAVGSAFDIVVGIRNLFGLRRLGLDLRAGWFFPGKAFLRNDGDDENPDFRKARKGIAIVTKIWW